MGFEKTNIRITATIGILLLIGLLFYIGYQQHRHKQERTEFALLEQERMQEELRLLEEEYAIQADKIRSGNGYGEQFLHLSTDSILEELGRAKAKVQHLSDELRLTKIENAQKIKELSLKVTSLRKVLQSYVIQIDSLQSANRTLRQENEQVKRNYNEVNRKAGELQKEHEDLTKRINLAAKLELSDVSCTPLDRHGKETKRLNRITHLRFDFTLLRNVSAEPGMRTVYVRLLNPNDMAISSPDCKSFSFEDTKLESTVSKEIEYGGENLTTSIYWSVDQTLLQGTYKADFFVDGDHIGRLTFYLN